jgi:ABC-type branched-subunit amino acid transport system ATPase component
MTPNLIVSPQTLHNGFLLSTNTEIKGSICVFVGRNGSGKTRFFQSIKHGATGITLDGKTLDPKSEITLMSSEHLIPSFGVKHDPHSLMLNISSTIIAYQEIQNLLDQPDYPLDSTPVPGTNQYVAHSRIYKLVQLIAEKSNKRPSELSAEDIRFYYTEVPSSVFGSHDLAGIFNRYTKKLNDNLYNEWRNEKYGKDLPYLSNDEFLRRFGEPPWDLLNRILNATFDGKFYIPEPKDLDSDIYNHQAQLVESGGRITASGELSSGEKTLLWLALSLFNSQYSDRGLLTPPKLVLLDEPDAFLHPKMVEKMYEVLKKFHEAFGSVFWIITHSPTTAALAPEGSLHLIEADSIESNDYDSAVAGILKKVPPEIQIQLTRIEPIDCDDAVAELLDGVPQIAIQPKNRRYVYVESHYDAAVYQDLFEFLRKRPEKLTQKISMSFVAGHKMPEQHLIDMAKKVFRVDDEEQLNDFVTAVNGVSNCTQVYAATKSFSQASNFGVKGLVDWDTRNTPTENVVVIGYEQFYAIENIILDPICLILQLHFLNPKRYSIKRYSGEDMPWLEWLDNEKLLQKSLDKFLIEFLCKSNKADRQIKYCNGITLITDSTYTEMNGHELEKKLLTTFEELNQIAHNKGEGALKRKIANIMIGASSGKLIPMVVVAAFAALQK